MSNYRWSDSSPYCLGLGKVFGYESSYRNSDMQFAKATAEYLFEAIKPTESYKERRGINTSILVLLCNRKVRTRDAPYQAQDSVVTDRN